MPALEMSRNMPANEKAFAACPGVVISERKCAASGMKLEPQFSYRFSPGPHSPTLMAVIAGRKPEFGMEHLFLASSEERAAPNSARFEQTHLNIRTV